MTSMMHTEEVSKAEACVVCVCMCVVCVCCDSVFDIDVRVTCRQHAQYTKTKNE